jgi:hypothetical protein
VQRRHVRGEVSGVHTLDTKDANIALFDTRCAIVNWLSPQQTGRFGNSPSLARSTATGLAIKHRADADAGDRQKLTPIRPKFGLNNVSARFHCVPAISQPRSCWGHFRCQGGHLPGEQAMGAVGRCVARLYRARCRGLSHGADLASGDLIQIFPPSFASHSDRLRIFPCDRRPCLDPSFFIASRETPSGPLLRLQQPSVIRSSV